MTPNFFKAPPQKKQAHTFEIQSMFSIHIYIRKVDFWTIARQEEAKIGEL